MAKTQWIKIETKEAFQGNKLKTASALAPYVQRGDIRLVELQNHKIRLFPYDPSQPHILIRSVAR